MSGRTFMLAGSGVRLAYGRGSLFAPDWMSGRLALTFADTPTAA